MEIMFLGTTQAVTGLKSLAQVDATSLKAKRKHWNCALTRYLAQETLR